MNLSPNQISSYSDNGYLLVKGLLTKPEAAALRAECHGLTQRLGRSHNTDATWAGARAMVAEKTVIHHCHNVQFYSAALAALLLDPRFTEAAADLIGPNVQLHHDKMFIKPPEKGSPFPMHQDYPYFPHERHTMTAAIFHFDDAPVEKGCLRVVPGSHKYGPLPHEGSYHLPLDKYPLEAATICEAEAGDVLFFNYLTIHGSGVNTSDEARTTLLVQFRDPEDRPLDEQHKSRGQGMMLRGVDPNPAPQFLE
ncbi:MAG TPA: phytanoyl-CoA dioxygenase family protein [Fimbriimonadaceae bacterium]|nr:phytanoyl-CoA dioxygenase family protein [Fimbriimonadaceae bacterium]